MTVDSWGPAFHPVSSKPKAPSQTGTWASCSLQESTQTCGVPVSAQLWCFFQVPQWVGCSSQTPVSQRQPFPGLPLGLTLLLPSPGLHQPGPTYLLTPHVHPCPSPIHSPHWGQTDGSLRKLRLLLSSLSLAGSTYPQGKSPTPPVACKAGFTPLAWLPAGWLPSAEGTLLSSLPDFSPPGLCMGNFHPQAPLTPHLQAHPSSFLRSQHRSQLLPEPRDPT